MYDICNFDNFTQKLFYLWILKKTCHSVEVIKVHFPKMLEEIRENNKAVPWPSLPKQDSLDFFLNY